MNKEELLQELSVKINTGEISKEELINRLSLTPQGSLETGTTTKNISHFSITKMLYVLGAAIVAIGIIIFVYQIWEELGSVGHISITLGLGLLITGLGSFLLKAKSEDKLGSVFFCIGGLLIPGGAMVTLSEFSTGQDPLWSLVITFAAIFIFYLLLNYVHKNAVLTFFAISNGTILVYAFAQALLGPVIYMNGDIYAYLTMAIGLSYLLLGYIFQNTWNKQLSGALNFFGTMGFLGAAFSRVFDSAPWQMLYFIVVIGCVFLSAHVRSRAILVISTLFLLAHVSYITGQYFADSVGWPICLVVLGFVFIALGYVSININKRYIKQ